MSCSVEKKNESEHHRDDSKSHRDWLVMAFLILFNHSSCQRTSLSQVLTSCGSVLTSSSIPRGTRPSQSLHRVLGVTGILLEPSQPDLSWCYDLLGVVQRKFSLLLRRLWVLCSVDGFVGSPSAFLPLGCSQLHDGRTIIDFLDEHEYTFDFSSWNSYLPIHFSFCDKGGHFSSWWQQWSGCLELSSYSGCVEQMKGCKSAAAARGSSASAVRVLPKGL